MRWFYIAVIIGIIITILTVLLFMLDVNLEYIFVVSSLATIIMVIPTLFFREEKERILKLLYNLYDEYQKEKIKNVENKETHRKEIKQIKQVVHSEKVKHQYLKRMVDNIGVTLVKENISKEDILKNITNPLKAIIFLKYWEDLDKKRYIIRDKIYPKIHAYHIKGGLRIIPPAYVPQDKSNPELIKWFKKQINDNVPLNYEYNIPLVCPVNLTDINAFKNLNKRFERGHFDWLENVPAKDIAPTDMLINYLETKKNISTRELIDIPNIMFLVDDNQISLEDKSILENKSNKIIDDIKNHLQIQDLKTTDLANIDDKELTIILSDNNVKRPLNVSTMLINNAKLWKIVLDRKLN